MTPTILIPDTTKGSFLTFVRNTWFARYWIDGKEKRKSMKTEHLDIAVVNRDAFYASLETTVKEPRTAAERVQANPKKYVYYRHPFTVKVEGKFVGNFKSRKLASEARDKYIQEITSK